MKHVKAGVRFHKLKPVMVDALIQLGILFHQYEYVLVVTAGSDGVHKPGSLHYRGYAVDLRTRDLPSWQIPLILDAIHHTLGRDFDAIQETTHIHVEYDPDHDGGQRLPDD